MAERRTIFANVAALAMGQAIAMVLGLMTHAILARAVGPADYGILGFAIAVISYFGVVAALGIDTWATREIAADRGRVREVTGAATAIRLALSTASFFGIVILVSAWGRDALIGTVVLIQGVSLFIAALSFDFAFQGIERMEAVARRQVLSAVIALAGVAASLNLGGGIVAAAVVLQCAAAAATLVMIWEFTRTVGFPIVGRRILGDWRGILRDNAPLAVTGLLVSLYTYIDVVMLGFMRPTVEVGLYVASVRIMMIGLVVAAVLRTAILPVLARLHTSPDQRREAGAHNAAFVSAAGGLAAAGGFVLAPDILTVIYGNDFREAATVLRLLMVNLLFANVAEVFHTQLVAWRLQNQQMLIMAGGAALNIALNLVTIPQYGMEGAAVATIASTLLVVALAALSLRRHDYETHAKIMVKSVLFAGTVGALGWWLDIPLEGAFPRFIVIGSGLSLLYIFLASALGIVRLDATVRYFTRT